MHRSNSWSLFAPRKDLISRSEMRHSRRGITLMEVLISIGVLSVGLLGLASLLPVARFFMADGSKYDHTAVMGQRALKDLEIRRELIDPSNWFAPAANGQFLEVCPETTTASSPPYGPATYHGAYNLNWFNVSPIATIPAAPFILDPMACAYPDNLLANGGTGAASGTGQLGTSGSFAPTFFPPSAYSLDMVNGAFASPALVRITVPRQNGVITSAFAFGPARFASPMSFGQAQKIFQSTDDLVFDFPSDQAQRPTQAPPSVIVSGSTADVKYATSNGDYSWFTVIDNMQRPWNPGKDGVWGTTGDDNGDGVPNDVGEAGWPLSDDVALWKTSGGELWHVWVVVIQKRNLQLVPTAADAIPPERMCYCDMLSAPWPPPAGATGISIQNNAGLGGGDCLLSVPASLSSSPEWLNVKVNQWIMLSAFPNLGTLASPVRGQLCMVQWFRITAVGDVIELPGNAGFQRSVTLSGPDWNPYRFFDALGVPPTTGVSGMNFLTAYATIVDGACGVIDATIEQGE